MRCEEVRPLISAGLDGELDGLCAGQLRTHLVECGSCSIEREALAATVRLLRELPEAEPPAALRRRIGVALLEVERASQRRRFGLPSLVWPHVPGWAWGATLGATVAAVALLVPHPQALNRRVASLPNSIPAAAPRLPVPAPSFSSASSVRKPAAATLKKAVTSKPRPALPAPLDRLTAALPPMPDAARPVPSRLAVLPALSRRHLIRSHQAHHLIMVARHFNPGMPAKLVTAHGTQAPNSIRPDRSVRSADDSTRLAQTGGSSSPNPATSQPPDQDPGMDTAGMTQMASGSGMGMPAAQEPEDDDLTELRQRLIDRPLQVPELGQLKPATASPSSRDGWIRF